MGSQETFLSFYYSGSHINLFFSFLSLFLDGEEKREGNQQHTDFYLLNLQEESDLEYSKPQDMRFELIRLEVSFGSLKHFQQVWMLFGRPIHFGISIQYILPSTN